MKRKDIFLKGFSKTSQPAYTRKKLILNWFSNSDTLIKFQSLFGQLYPCLYGAIGILVKRKSLEKWKTPLRVSKAIDDALYAGQIKKKKKSLIPPFQHTLC